MKPTELARALREIENSVYNTDVDPFRDTAFERFADERAHEWFTDILESAPQHVVDWFRAIIPQIADHLEQHGGLGGFAPKDHVIMHLQPHDEILRNWLSGCSSHLNKALEKRPDTDTELFDHAQRFAIEDCFRTVLKSVEKLLTETPRQSVTV